MDSQVVTLIFTIVTGIGVLLQACVLLGMYFALRETQKKIHGLTEKIEDHILPLIHTSSGLITDLTPKVKIITDNLVDASTTLRAQAANVKTVVEDVTVRTRQQTARVDGIVTGALNSITQATSAVERGIAAPLRQVSNVLNGLRAGLDTLRAKPADAHKAIPRPAAPQTHLRPVVSAQTVRISESLQPQVSTEGAFRPVAAREEYSNSAAKAETTPEEASAAAARFVRDRAAATSGERR